MSFQKAKDIYNKRLQKSIADVDKYFPGGHKPLPDKVPTNVRPLLKLLHDEDYAIVTLGGIELLDKLATGKLSSVQVTGAFIRAALLAHKLVNCATEFLAERAYERAKFLDEHLKEKGPVGPFHGLPVSVKELLAVKGHISTCENSYFLDSEPQEDDSTLIKEVERQGGTIFVRTNGPQFCNSLDSYSPVHGSTLNPYNTGLTTGGSSSGEGALAAFGASIIGLGTDIGGSIRVPSSFCGIYGLKPTKGRLSLLGSVGSNPGNDFIKAVVGPMSRDLRLIELLMETIIVQKPWKDDVYLEAVPWEVVSSIKPKKLTLGYTTFDGLVHPHPPVVSTIEELVAKFDGKVVDGVELTFKKFTPLIPADIVQTLVGCFMPDAGERIRKWAEKFEEPIEKVDLGTEIEIKKLEIADVFALNIKRDKYRQAAWEDWKKQGIDAVVYPAYISPSSVIRTPNYGLYSMLWNILDYPGISLPVTTVDPQKDYGALAEPASELDKAFLDLYAPEKFDNAPIGVQIVAPRFEESLLVKIAQLLQGNVKPLGE
ncbi:putative amidase PB8B6.03 [Yarrowia sp. B02]|nr:putative amidase PB8B6.03 [Yarrowia sp. B02]